MKILVKTLMGLGILVMAASNASAQTTVRFYTEAPQTYYPVVEQPQYVPQYGQDDRGVYIDQWRAQPEWQARREWRERRDAQLRREQWLREQEWRRSHWEYAQRHHDDWQREQWRRRYHDADDQE